MEENWRYSAKSVTKYNPLFRNSEGHYTKDEWIGYFQLGENINGEVLTLDKYLETERKYILAAKLFFHFHGYQNILVKNLEKENLLTNTQNEMNELSGVYGSIHEASLISIDDIDNVIKLILRGVIWAELFSSQNESIAVRFGYDMYMYFNSDKEWDKIVKEINQIGLFVN